MQFANDVLRVLPALAAAGVAAVYFVHMLQLASYQFGYYSRNIKKNFVADFLKNRLIALMAFLPLIIAPWNANIKNDGFAYALVFVVYIRANAPKKAKKPLVYTPRVKRLLFTTACICLIPAIAVFSGFNQGIFVLAGVIYLMPIVMVLANLINMPIEKLITRYYTNDARKILRRSPRLTVIGITGSFGKTSTKYFLNSLLSVKYNVLMTPGNYNTTLGVVRAVRELLKPIHEVFICEMGARHIGDIKEICDLVHPKYGIITSIGEQHLESFGTIENIAKTKFELADCVCENGLAFLNFDSQQVRAHAPAKNMVSYGSSKGVDYTSCDISVTAEGTRFAVVDPAGEKTEFKTRLLGEHNVQNIMAAIAVCHKLGVEMKKIQPAVRALESVPHRMELIRGAGYSVIDDAYNSNPKGAKAALDTLALCEGTKILVTPGMIELGARESELNCEFGAQAAAVCDYIALVGAKQTEPIKRGILGAGFDESKLFVGATLQEALAFAQKAGAIGTPKFVLLENDLPDNY